MRKLTIGQADESSSLKAYKKKRKHHVQHVAFCLGRDADQTLTLSGSSEGEKDWQVEYDVGVMLLQLM